MEVGIKKKKAAFNKRVSKVMTDWFIAEIWLNDEIAFIEFAKDFDQPLVTRSLSEWCIGNMIMDMICWMRYL